MSDKTTADDLLLRFEEHLADVPEPAYLALRDAIAAALLAERERCAKVADAEAAYWSTFSNLSGATEVLARISGKAEEAKQIADAIRDRGN